MKRLTAKEKKYRLNRAKKIARRKRKRRKSKRTYKRLRRGLDSLRDHSPRFHWLEAPEHFRLEDKYCDGVLDYIDTFKRLTRAHWDIEVDLRKVKLIGPGAIAMLLSVMKEAEKYPISISGRKPEDKNARMVLEKSGFFDHVTAKLDDPNNKSKSSILFSGRRQTPHKSIAAKIELSMQTVWKRKGRNPYLYSATFEMMQNSRDHAFNNLNSTIWHFAITHDETNNLVKFSFVDNGRGILKTFKNGLLKRFIHVFSDDVDILASAFESGIESRTGLQWRGKGLPTIYENYTEGYVKNLLIISNDVFIHYDRGIKRKLKKGFSGTYYYFEVDQSCKKACF